MTQIAWRPFDEASFAEAAAQNKPVLLSVTAVWCHFCKIMDEQTYANEAIAQYIDEHFIPIRVDSEKRPDINARYAMGGLPATCALTPEGDVIWGGTSLAPDAMAQLLPQILNSFHNDKATLTQHIAEQREQIKQQAAGPSLDPSLQVTTESTRAALMAIKHNFDFAYGGFGREQKFAHTDALELCLQQYARSLAAGTPDADLYIVLGKTLWGMNHGGLHDRDGGGFFRYTQTPDWREPNYEKLLEDNALIARTFTHAYQLLDNDLWKTAAEKTLRFLDTTLYDLNKGIWGGSQDADVEYYAQPLAERVEWNPPTVDKTILCGPNAQAARAHVAWWQVTGDTEALAIAKGALDFLLTHHLREDGALQHFLSPEAEDERAAGRMPTGLLADAADVTAACLDLYEAGQGTAYLDQAERIANWVQGHLEDPRGGGLFDAVTRPEAVGNMKWGTKDITDNMQMADALLRLFLATGDQQHARLAQRTLQAFVPALGQLGFFGASYALAAERAVSPPIQVHILGALDDPRTQALLKAAHRPYRFERFVQCFDPADADDAEYLQELQYPPVTEPIAYVSVAMKRLEPTSDPAQLSELVRTAA